MGRDGHRITSLPSAEPYGKGPGPRGLTWSVSFSDAREDLGIAPRGLSLPLQSSPSNPKCRPDSRPERPPSPGPAAGCSQANFVQRPRAHPCVSVGLPSLPTHPPRCPHHYSGKFCRPLLGIFFLGAGGLPQVS